MSQRATVKFANNETEFLLHSFDVRADRDMVGQRHRRPNPFATVGMVDLVIESDDTHFLAGLSIFTLPIEDFEIKLYRRDQDSTLKTYKFIRGFVMNYNESYRSISNSNVLISLTIQAH